MPLFVVRLEGRLAKKAIEATICMKRNEFVKFTISGQNVILLIGIRLLRETATSAVKSGELKMKVSPTMYMKTKENENDILASPTMLMKTNDLSFSTPRCC